VICRLGGFASPSGTPHVSAVSDDHDAVEHSAPSDAVAVGSKTPKFKPLIVQLELLPMLAGAFDGPSTPESTGAALTMRNVRPQTRRCAAANEQRWVPDGICAGQAAFYRPR
jgi:hypothetical protein